MWCPEENRSLFLFNNVCSLSTERQLWVKHSVILFGTTKFYDRTDKSLAKFFLELEHKFAFLIKKGQSPKKCWSELGQKPNNGQWTSC